MSIETHIKKNYSLKSLSTFDIGGKARYFVAIHTIEEMQQIMYFVQKESLSFLVVGKGSNILFDDRGFDGLIILNAIHFMQCQKGSVVVGAGYPFSLLGVKTAKQGWSGLEFAACIPGTVGGAIYMNAGANGYQTQDVLVSVSYVDLMGMVDQKKKEELQFSYRFSSFQRMKGVIVAGQFMLTKDKDSVKKQLDMISYRTHTQPYGEKSVGSIFRNLDHISAGALIEQCGLKGKKIGDAEVSVKHANFIINKGHATAQDVLDLMMLLKEIVKDKTGEELQEEVCFIPYQGEYGKSLS